jgi:hypothetical protein
MNDLTSIVVSLAVLTCGATFVAAAGEAPDLSGAELYATFCASCHGAGAHGDERAASSTGVLAPDLTALASRHRGAFPTRKVQRIIDGRSRYRAHGSRAMPVWGNQFYGYDGEDPVRRDRVSELIASMVEYLRSIQVANGG